MINGARHVKIGKPETSLNWAREDSKTFIPESGTDKLILPTVHIEDDVHAI